MTGQKRGELAERQVEPDEGAGREAQDAAAITASLERILCQPGFLASPRLASFLRFVITEKLDGRAARLKAFTVASMALGHDEKFNPKTNSIVRVQAGRLRRLLELYYEGPGRFERHEIRLPRGSYVPEFLLRGVNDLALEARPPVSGVPADVPSAVARPKWFARGRGRLVNAASLFLIAAALGFGAWMLRGGFPVPPVGGETSTASNANRWNASAATIAVDRIDVPSNDPAMRAFTSNLEIALEDALSRFDDPIVLHGVGGQLASEPDYRLSGSVTPGGDGNLSLAFRIWHPASGEIIWTRTFDDLRLEKTETVLEPIVGSLTSAVAQTYGVVFTDMHKRLRGQTDGFGCSILAFDYFETPSAQALAAARACLEHAVAAHPDFAPGFAALAYLMVDSYLTGLDARPDEKPLDIAIQMAQRAVDLTPQKAHAHAALFLTRFYDKRFEDAFESADRALQLNPYATDTPARIGAAYVLRGNFDKGIALLQRAVRFSPSPPAWYDFFFFLDAYMRGDDHSAIRHAMRRSATRYPLGLLARIIVAHEQGDADAVAQWSQKLVAAYPTFAADIPAAFERYAMAPEISARLIASLDAAGFPPPVR